jgi:hypothetical protein
MREIVEVFVSWGGCGLIICIIVGVHVFARQIQRSLPLRVYVAASSQELRRARIAMQAVTDFAHEVTHDWTAPIEAVRAQGIEEHETPSARQYAEADLCGIERSDVVWMLAPREPTVGFWVELGYAIRARKPIVISGPTTAECQRNIFLFCEGVHVVLREYDDERTAMAWISLRHWKKPSAWWSWATL